MSIKLFERIATLVKADAHGVVESLEERSLLLKQCVREAEIELNQKRARLEALREEEKRLGEAVARHEDDIRGLDEDIDLALAGGKEEIARFAARRLIPRRKELKAMRAQLEHRAVEVRTLAERLTAQEAQFEALRVRVRAELARPEATADSPAWTSEVAVADEEVELELLRRRRSSEEVAS